MESVRSALLRSITLIVSMITGRTEKGQTDTNDAPEELQKVGAADALAARVKRHEQASGARNVDLLGALASRVLREGGRHM